MEKPGQFYIYVCVCIHLMPHHKQAYGGKGQLSKEPEVYEEHS